MEQVEEQQKEDSTLIQDMGLEKEQEMELDLYCSFQGPEYQEPRDIHILSSSSEDECETGLYEVKKPFKKPAGKMGFLNEKAHGFFNQVVF